MTVVRGGRVPREDEEAKLRLAQDREQSRLKQLHQDLAVLLRLPEFQRYGQHLMAKCGTFDCKEDLTSMAYRNQARRAVGVEICDEWGAADRKIASEMMTKMLYSTLEPKE
jgi:hypothetical protein